MSIGDFLRRQLVKSMTWWNELNTQYQSQSQDPTVPSALIQLLFDWMQFEKERKLQSAEGVLDQILELDLHVADRAHWCLERGKFCWVDLGDGVRTRQYFEQAYDLAIGAEPLARADVKEVAAHAAENMLLMSLTYDECSKWVERLRNLAPKEGVLHEQWPMLKKLVDDGHPWSAAMMMIAGSWFNPDPAQDPGKYGPAAAIIQLMLIHRKSLRLDRQHYWSCAGMYASLVVKLWANAGRTQEKLFGGKSYPDELKLVLLPAIPLLQEAVELNPDDPKLRGSLEMVVQCATNPFGDSSKQSEMVSSNSVAGVKDRHYQEVATTISGKAQTLHLEKWGVDGPNLVLEYSWNELLSHADADRLDTRARAFLNEATAKAALAANLAVVPGPPTYKLAGSWIPSWFIAGRQQATYVQNSQFDPNMRRVRFTIGTPMVTSTQFGSGSFDPIPELLGQQFQRLFMTITA